MKILIEKSFEKDMRKISAKTTKIKVASIIEEVIEAKSLLDIRNCKKMKVHESAYRIRLGDYRIGIFYENETVIFSRILHRSTVYKYYP